MSRLFSAAVLLAVLPTLVSAQEPEYEPRHDNPSGEELVLAFVSSTWCVGNRAPGLHEAIEQAKLTMSQRAVVEGIDFRAIGVSLDWPADSGIAYLKEFGEFDEMVVGSNWWNMGAQALIWEDEQTNPSIPQVIIFRREISTTPSFGPRHVLKRVEGGDTIVDWVQTGAKLSE